LEHAVVDSEVGEAHVEECKEVVADGGVFHLHHLLVVGDLGGDDLADADGVCEGRNRSFSGGRSLNLDFGPLILSKSRFVGLFNVVLLSEIEGGVLISFNNLGCLRDGLLDHNISPDLVAKAVVIRSHHAEVRSVATGLGRSHQVSSHFEVRTSSDDPDNGSEEVQLVTVGLDEHGIARPVGLAIVAHGPLLLEVFAGVESVAVTKTLLHEASGVLDELLGFLGLRLGLSLGDWLIEVLAELLANDVDGRGHFILALSHQVTDTVLVLANNAVRSLIRLPDLKHRVLFVDATLFAFPAQIIVMAHAALVPDSNDGRSTTPITSKLGVFDGGLCLQPSMHVVLQEAGERLLDHGPHFLLDHRDEGKQFLGLDEACAVALLAGSASLVPL